jgi:hypothetical protein
MSTFERSPTTEQGSRPVYKVYKRRFWGLAQLVLLNIVVSWDVCATSRLIHIPTLQIADSHIQWLTFSSISTTAAEYFDVSESAINWMSTGYLFAFCVVSP